MEKDVKRSVMLGALVAGGVLLFTISIFIIGSRESIFNNSVTIYSTFKDISGIRKGDYVRYAGVKVGVVNGVKIVNDTTVRIKLSLDLGMLNIIRKNAIVSISSDGLMGSKMVKIKMRNNFNKSINYIADGDTLASVNPMDMDAITKKFLSLGNDAETVMQDFSQISDHIKNGEGVLGMLIEDTSAASRLKHILNEVSLTSDKSVQISRHLLDITNSLEHGEGAASMLLNDTSMKGELKQIIDYLNVSSRYMDQITTDISGIMNNKKSTGQDSVFANDIRRSIDNIKEGTEKFNENMDALQHNILLRHYFKKHKKELHN